MRRRKQLSRLADEELMPLVATKDPDAFEVFYERHAGAAFSLAHRIVGDPGRAEDVTQEGFMSIWRSESGYDAARGSVRGWLLGVVRNRAIDAIRRDAARPAPALGLDPAQILDRRPSRTSTDSEVLRGETARELRGLLGTLPREQMQVIELAYFGGFTQSEIAQMLGTPLGTVKGRIRMGLEKIRAGLAEGQS
jgi:RNA polymerase sigma-70 factor (ECF subfamily)